VPDQGLERQVGDLAVIDQAVLLLEALERRLEVRAEAVVELTVLPDRRREADAGTREHSLDGQDVLPLVARTQDAHEVKVVFGHGRLPSWC
jgi:hypothetical protein